MKQTHVCIEHPKNEFCLKGIHKKNRWALKAKISITRANTTIGFLIIIIIIKWNHKFSISIQKSHNQVIIIPLYQDIISLWKMWFNILDGITHIDWYTKLSKIMNNFCTPIDYSKCGKNHLKLMTSIPCRSIVHGHDF